MYPYKYNFFKAYKYKLTYGKIYNSGPPQSLNPPDNPHNYPKANTCKIPKQALNFLLSIISQIVPTEDTLPDSLISNHYIYRKNQGASLPVQIFTASKRRRDQYMEDLAISTCSLQPPSSPQKRHRHKEPATSKKFSPEEMMALNLSPYIRLTLLISPNHPYFQSRSNLSFLKLKPSYMDEMLANMWNSLSLTENEAITLQIDNNKLSVPRNALLGKLAMRKHVSTFEVDKGLKTI